MCQALASTLPPCEEGAVILCQGGDPWGSQRCWALPLGVQGLCACLRVTLGLAVCPGTVAPSTKCQSAGLSPGGRAGSRAPWAPGWTQVDVPWPCFMPQGSLRGDMRIRADVQAGVPALRAACAPRPSPAHSLFLRTAGTYCVPGSHLNPGPGPGGGARGGEEPDVGLTTLPRHHTHANPHACPPSSCTGSTPQGPCPEHGGLRAMAYCHHPASASQAPREDGMLVRGSPARLFVRTDPSLQTPGTSGTAGHQVCGPPSPRWPPSASPCLLKVPGPAFFHRLLMEPHRPFPGHHHLLHAGLQADHVRITARSGGNQTAFSGDEGSGDWPWSLLRLWPAHLPVSRVADFRDGAML